MKRQPKRSKVMKKIQRQRGYRGLGSNGVHKRHERRWNQMRSLYQ